MFFCRATNQSAADAQDVKRKQAFKEKQDQINKDAHELFMAFVNALNNDKNYQDAVLERISESDCLCLMRTVNNTPDYTLAKRVGFEKKITRDLIVALRRQSFKHVFRTGLFAGWLVTVCTYKNLHKNIEYVEITFKKDFWRCCRF